MVKERLLAFIKHLGLTVSNFEKKVKLSNGYVNNIRKGIGDDVLTKISEEYPQLNKTWLVLGEGDMLNAPQDIVLKDNTLLGLINVTRTNADTNRLRAETELLNATARLKEANTIERLVDIYQATNSDGLPQNQKASSQNFDVLLEELALLGVGKSWQTKEEGLRKLYKNFYQQSTSQGHQV